MPRTRKYESAAARQAAYRDRVYWQQAPTQKLLAGMAEGLHQDLLRALQQGNSPLPAELVGVHAGETLDNLRDYVRYGSVEAARKARSLADCPTLTSQSNSRRRGNFSFAAAHGAS